MNEETHVYLNKLEKKIKHYFIEALIYLKLPLISLNCREIIIPDNNEPYPEYNLLKNTITVHLHSKELIVDHSHKTKDMSNKDIDIFVLFHEIGHYWHNTYHNKHFEKFRENYRHLIYFRASPHEPINLEYNKQNLEKHANNIAKILYKKLYKEI